MGSYYRIKMQKKREQFPFSKLMGSQWLWCQTCVSSSCSCCQTYSQLAHPIQQARALGLLFQSKVLDIDNIDVSFVLLFFLPSNQPSHSCLLTPMFCLWLYIFFCFTLLIFFEQHSLNSTDIYCWFEHLEIRFLQKASQALVKTPLFV